MLQDPAFWVAISFFGFIGVALYFKLPGMIGKQLDLRADRIKTELDDAQRLREDAQALYAEYQRKTENAAKEAEAIIEQAMADAEEIARESRAQTETMLRRRQALAEAKIAQAEAKAVADVREATVEVAIAAARQVMTDAITGDKAEELVENSIADLGKHLN